MSSMKEGQYARMLDNFIGSYSGYVQVHSNGYWDERILDNSFTTSDSLIDEIIADPGVKDVVPRLESVGLAAAGDLTKFTALIGFDPEKEKLLSGLDQHIVEGEYLQPGDRAALVGKGLADYLDLKVGDTIVFIGPGYHGASAWGKLPIKGLIKMGSPDMNKRMIFVPVKELQWSTDAMAQLTSSILILEDVEKAGEVAKRLGDKLGTDYEVMTWDQMNPVIKQSIEFDRREGYVLTGILYVVIGFGMFGTVLMMLAERQHEFGVLTAIGMKRWWLGMIVTIELVTISLLGAIAGMIGGFPVVAYFHYSPIRFGDELTEMMEDYGFEAILQTSMDPMIFIKQAFLVFVMACVIGIFPFFKIIRIKSVEAMRS